ncbi:hypothetical protein GCM10027452_01690 [Micromonospora halotolerans]
MVDVVGPTRPALRGRHPPRAQRPAYDGVTDPAVPFDGYKVFGYVCGSDDQHLQTGVVRTGRK